MAASKKKMEDLKNQFSKFLGVANEISVLHKNVSNSRSMIDSDVTHGLDPDLNVKFSAPGNERDQHSTDQSLNGSNVIDELDRVTTKINCEIDSMQKVDCCADSGNASRNMEFSLNGVNHELNSMQQLDQRSKIGCTDGEIDFVSNDIIQINDSMQETVSIFNKGGNVINYSTNDINVEMNSMKQLDQRLKLNCTGGEIDFVSNDIIQINDTTQETDRVSIFNHGGNVINYSLNGTNVEMNSMQQLDERSKNNCTSGEMDILPNDIMHKNYSMPGKYSVSICNFADGVNLVDYSGNDINHEINLMQELDHGSKINYPGDENDFGSHPQETAKSNKDFFFSEFDKLEFISEAEVAALDGYEVIMDLDLELACNVDYNLHSTTTNVMESVETTVHVIEQSNSLYAGVTMDQNTFGPTNETSELEPDSEFSNVKVTTMKDVVLDEPVVRKIDIKITHGCDNLNMMVPTSSDPNPKKYCCVYCNKRYSKLVRHLLFLHKNEPDVKKIRDSPPGSKQRRKVIDNLRNRGQFVWNTNAELNGKELSTCRRPNKKFNRTAPQFKTCPNCYGAFVSTNLSHHFKNCTNATLKGERIVLELSRAMEGRIHIDACEELRNEVFARMRENEYVRSIRYDWLIITFGNDLCLNYDITLESQFKMICTKLGDAGKLLVASKSISSDISDFASLFQVKNCNTVVSGIHKVAGFDSKSKKFRSRGQASALATLMNAIGELLIVEVMKLDDQDKEQKVERFLKVFQKDVRNKVNRLVALQQSQARRERVENIPSTFDVNQVATYVDGERDQCFAELSEQFTEEKWLYLSQLTVLSIMLFNRRRTGESKTILLKEYENRQTITGNSNIPDDVRELVNSMMRVRGKRNRTVPVLLHHSYEDCIDLIIRHRDDAGVPEQNKYLFALPSKSGKIKTIDTCQAVKSISEKSGVQNHASLRGTNLRKQLASFCSTLNLSDNDVTNVANHMGHDDPIHREFYRHNPLEREVVQMTRILVAAQGNHINTPGTSSDEFRKNLLDESRSECGGAIVKKGGKNGTARIAAATSNRKERGKVGKRGRSRQ